MECSCAKKGRIYHRQFTVSLCGKDLRRMCGRYHFSHDSYPLLKAVYESCMKDCRISLYFRLDYKEAGQTAVLLTLGDNIDKRQNTCMEEGKMSEAYMMECLAMEILNKAYVQTGHILYEISGMYAGSYKFPGSELPLAVTADVIEDFQQKEVRCNEMYMLLPKKSVVYLTKMQNEKPKAGKEQLLCAECKNEGCIHRMEPDKESISIKARRALELNYGYQRIFGKAGEKKCRLD